MNFDDKLISGTFVKRYKRFFVDVKLKNSIITAHCPNTGSMFGLLEKGNKVWITKTSNPNRKLKYTLQIIESHGCKVGINTHLTNKIFYHGLSNNLLKELKNLKNIIPEVKYDTDTRFDFLINCGKKKSFIEVKNVTLSRKKGVAEFPDAVTSRGLKHVKKLLEAKTKGYDIYIVFIIQRDDCKTMQIAKDIDLKYSKLLTLAVKNNLKVICYDCKFSPKGIIINNNVKFKLND